MPELRQGRDHDLVGLGRRDRRRRVPPRPRRLGGRLRLDRAGRAVRRRRRSCPGTSNGPRSGACSASRSSPTARTSRPPAGRATGRDAIAREVFEREPPLNFPYEFLNIAGKKMSTSKGLGAAAHTFTEVVPPEQTRFLFVRPRPESAIDFDPEGTDAVPRLFDEFDRLGAATAGREVKGELPPGYDSIFRYSLLDAGGGRRARRRAPSGRRSRTSRCSSRCPGVDVHARVAAEKGARADRGRGGGARGPPRGRPPLARGVRPRARTDRDPARRAAGRGRPAAPRAARLPAGPRRGGPRRRARDRRAVAGGDLRRGRGPRPRRQGRVHRPLPRVPRPAQRPACGLAAGEPRPRTSSSAASARPASSTEAMA